MSKKQELYEYQYTTPSKKVVKECLPAVRKPSGRSKNKNKVNTGRLLQLIGALGLLAIPSALGTSTIFSILVRLGIWGGCFVAGTLRVKEGKEYLGRISRYGRYMKVLEDKKYASVEELSETVAGNIKTVVRDLEFMMENKWFLEGHFDRTESQFILTDKVYEEYQKSEKGRELREEEERKRQEIENDPVLKEVQSLLQEGDSYVKRIHKLNDMILGEHVSAQLDRIENLLISIFDLVKRRPEKAPELRKLMQYYLPMTVKVVTSYRDFENEKIHSRQLEDSKREIQETLEKVKEALESLRERLFHEDVLDISTDLDVLETMMSQEGLIEDEWKI